MRHSELLAAISDLEPIEARGSFQRHCSLRWDGLRPSAAGGRWGERGAFEVLYLGRPAESVIVEAYRHRVDDDIDHSAELAATVVERRLYTMDVAVPNVLDLRPMTARRRVGLTDDQFRSDIDDYTPCQAVAAAAHQLGLGGILAPAATGLGETSPCSRSTSHTCTSRPSPTARSGTACQPTRVGCAWPTTQARPGRMTPVR